MYVAVFYRRRRREARSFSSFEAARGFMHDGAARQVLSPIAIWQADSNRLWLWSGYSRGALDRSRALRDAKAALSLPAYHLFGAIEEFDD
jgi:hypothetical protein